MKTKPTILSYDEKKAAAAAFNGEPFDPTWSTSARAIYDGLANVLSHPPVANVVAPTVEHTLEPVVTLEQNTHLNFA